MPPDIDLAAEDCLDRLWARPQDLLDDKAHEERLDTTELLEDHVTSMLAEARETYTTQSPPFLHKNGAIVKCTAGSRLRVHLAKSNGKITKPAREVDLVARVWGENQLYWTLDLNGERVILKSFRGGPSNFRRWLGPVAGFQALPLAFGIRTLAGWSTKMSEDDSSNYESGRYPKRQRRVSGRRREASVPSEARNHGHLESDLSSLSPSPEHLRARSDADLTQTSPKPLRSSVLPGLSSFDKEPRKKNGPSKGIRLHVSGSLARFTNMGQLSPQDSQWNRPNEGFSLPNAEPTSSSKKASTIDQASKRESTNGFQALDPGIRYNSPSRLNSMHKKVSADRTSSNEDPVHKPIQSPLVPESAPPRTMLSAYKQANTTLCVFLPPSPDCVPLKLRSCMTMDAFFSTAVAAFELHDQAHTIAALKVTFNQSHRGYEVKNPTDDGDAATTTWLVKRAVPDSFEIFLDVVDGLPVWEEGGKCGVRVDIILRG